MKKNYEAISFFQRGKRRKAIMMALNVPKTPTEIARQCKMSKSNVSNALKELQKEKYVECKNPGSHTFKYFGLTRKGEEILKMISKEF